MDRDKDIDTVIDELESIISLAKRDCARSPQGSLYIIDKGSVHQYYIMYGEDGRKRRYLKRAEDKIAYELAQKEYAKRVLKLAEHDRKALERVSKLRDYNDYVMCFKKMSENKQLLVTPYVLDNTDFAAAWETKHNAIKESMKDTRVHALSSEEEDAIITERGEVVRSKSEKIICDKLNRSGIPYIYEYPINLNGIGYVRPDFYVLNVRTREAFYWEQFGMMDNPEYSGNAVRKIEMYEKNKIFPGRSLILTYETSNHPINNMVVDEMIEEYLM